MNVRGLCLKRDEGNAVIMFWLLLARVQWRLLVLAPACVPLLAPENS